MPCTHPCDQILTHVVRIHLTSHGDHCGCNESLINRLRLPHALKTSLLEGRRRAVDIGALHQGKVREEGGEVQNGDVGVGEYLGLRRDDANLGERRAGSSILTWSPHVCSSMFNERCMKEQYNIVDLQYDELLKKISERR